MGSSSAMMRAGKAGLTALPIPIPIPMIPIPIPQQPPRIPMIARRGVPAAAAPRMINRALRADWLRADWLRADWLRADRLRADDWLCAVSCALIER